MAFALHPQLAADTVWVADLPLCRVLLMKNARFPWLVLVPRREAPRLNSEAVAHPYISELFDLPPAEHDAAMREMREVAKRFSKMTRADKMNIAALGNVVPQLHIHIIARFSHDAAWPAPVWNCSLPPLAYSPAELENLVGHLRGSLQDMV